jgi:hypothetical protein
MEQAQGNKLKMPLESDPRKENRNVPAGSAPPVQRTSMISVPRTTVRRSQLTKRLLRTCTALSTSLLPD